MNETIKELAEQACLHKEWFIDNPEIEKFAELIVRECAGVIDRGDGAISSIAETIWCNQCRDDILEHFGVEE